MKKFFESNTSEFGLVSNQVNYLFEQYQQINQFIKSNFPEEYHNLLAKPERKANVLEWYTTLDGEFLKIEFLPAEEKSRILGIYNARRHEIDNKCAILARSDDFDKQIWAGILKSAFDPNHVQLFSNGKEILLVWGIKTMKQSDYTIPFDNYSQFIVPVNPKMGLEENDGLATPEESILPETENIDANNIEETVDDQPFRLTDFSEIPEPKVEPQPIVEPPVYETKSVTEEPQNAVENDTRPKIRPHHSKHWFYFALDRFEDFVKRYWWILLILLILILLLVLYKCNPTNEVAVSDYTEEQVEERFKEIMPPTPRNRSIPIDTNNFEEDDKGNVIVAGLLNVAMVDNKDKFKRMAVELKAAFPDSAHKIVYYDELTHRLQFNFPEEENDSMKQRIIAKLPNYKLLIWNESVFEYSKTSDDPFFKDANKSWHMKAINLEKAWDITQGDSSVYVAVIDDGFDMNHPELKGKRIKSPYNIVSKDKNVFGNDNLKHGTHVASLALGLSGNKSGLSGVAPNCTFMPVQIGGGGDFFTSTDVIDGVLYSINNGADVINMSLGKYFGETLKGKSASELEGIVKSSGKDEELFWAELFKLANDKNCTIVVAGGNENLLIGLDPMQRSNAIVKVVATTNKNQKATFSNYCVNCGNKEGYISAPGAAIWSAVPGNKFESFDGTSMAAPIVTGAIALIKSVKPTITNAEILKLLKETSKAVADKNCPPLLQIDAALKKIKK